MKKHAEYIKNLFIALASSSHFPQISPNDLVVKVKDWKLFGTNSLNEADIFISVTGAFNKEIDFRSKIKIVGLLTRFEFFDTLIRIAKKRFFDSKEVKTVAAAIETLIE